MFGAPVTHAYLDITFSGFFFSRFFAYFPLVRCAGVLCVARFLRVRFAALRDPFPVESSFFLSFLLEFSSSGTLRAVFFFQPLFP